MSKGTHPYGLGKWSYVHLRGQGGSTILIVTAYCVCSQSLQSTGATTSTAQQFRKLSKMAQESEILEDLATRIQFILDL
jgi:hypothetical protein